MNGGADLGGLMGLGPITVEQDELLFHAEWEKRAFGMTIALGACGQWNIDTSRYTRENVHPADYMVTPYYKIWIDAAIRLMMQRSMISETEIETGTAIDAPAPVKPKLKASDVDAVLSAGGPADRPTQGHPVWQVGDHIKTVNNHPRTHTRLPRYARDKTGEITKVHGFHVFPDSNALGLGEDPRWLYQVTFKSRDLWGEQGNPLDTISLDLWEPYLKALQ